MSAANTSAPAALRDASDAALLPTTRTGWPRERRRRAAFEVILPLEPRRTYMAGFLVGCDGPIIPGLIVRKKRRLHNSLSNYGEQYEDPGGFHRPARGVRGRGRSGFLHGGRRAHGHDQVRALAVSGAARAGAGRATATAVHPPARHHRGG